MFLEHSFFEYHLFCCHGLEKGHPQHAKRLLRAMAENVKKYEEMHGEIIEHEIYPNMPMNFGGPTGLA